MTCFRDVLQAIIMATVWIDDDRTIRRPTPLTTWQPRPTQCTWTRHLTSERARSLLVVLRRHLHSSHTTSRGLSYARVCLISSMHEVSVSLRLWALYSIQLLLLLIHLQSPAVPATLLLPRGSLVTLYSVNKEMGLTDESYFRTRTDRHRLYPRDKGTGKRTGINKFTERRRAQLALFSRSERKHSQTRLILHWKSGWAKIWTEQFA